MHTYAHEAVKKEGRSNHGSSDLELTPQHPGWLRVAFAGREEGAGSGAGATGGAGPERAGRRGRAAAAAAGAAGAGAGRGGGGGSRVVPAGAAASRAAEGGRVGGRAAPPPRDPAGQGGVPARVQQDAARRVSDGDGDDACASFEAWQPG